MPADLDAVVEAARAAFAVPGLGLAVVQDGAVLLAKGYGERHLGAADPVSATTRFGIASNTKVFTAVALGLLVEQGALGWDDRVQDHLPGFQMSDPYVSREMTVRDLLVHRSGLGLGAGDLLWWPGSTLDRPEIVRRLRHVPLATGFRSAYAYDNVLYLVAGELIEAVSGRTWEDYVRERILVPVGMTHSCVRYDDVPIASDGDIAGTHAEVDGAVAVVSPMRTDNTNPAGGVMSCADDMARWMNVLLRAGALGDDGRLFSRGTARELMTLVTPIPIDAGPSVFGDLRPRFQGYALGLGVRDYRGHKIVTHTGGLPGYVSRVLMVPDRGFGVAVLTNMESLRAIDAIVWHLLDHALGHGGEIDWLERHRAADQRARDRLAAARDRAAAARQADSAPSLPLGDYAATYRDAWCGDVAVTLRDGALQLAFADTPLLSGPLEHWQHDTFVARWSARELRADAFVTFVLGPGGDVVEVRMAAASPDVDFSFDFHHLTLVPVRERR
ncbi:MAG: serine hydrolase [Planctomycetota bacterium]